MRLSLLVVFLAIVCSACKDGINSPTVKPTALGKMNEIVVIADQDVWDGPLGDSIRHYLGGPYIITPRPEPQFDLKHFTAEKIASGKYRNQLRTYLIVGDLSNASSLTSDMIRKDIGEERLLRSQEDKSFHSSVGKNKWANGQLIVYLFGYGQDEIMTHLRNDFEIIASKVLDHDKNQLETSTYAMGENKGLANRILEDFGLNMRVPRGFVVAEEQREDDHFLWIRKETKHGNMSMIFKEFEYLSPAQMSKENMKKIRDEYGRKYVSSSIAGSYMLINDVDLPIFEYTEEIDGKYTKEYRGIWEIENDFMGGPFISYLILDQDRNKLIYVDAFVFAPGKKKRDEMMQLDLMVTRGKK